MLAPWVDLQSRLKLSFGQTLTQDEETKTWSKPKKSTDLIDWETLALFKFENLKKYVDPYAAFRVESQFLNAKVEQKKRYFDPILLTESAGLARELYRKKDDEILSRLGFAFRQTLKQVIIDSATFETTDSTLTDGGFESVTDVSLTLSERLSYTGKLGLYKAIFFSKKDEVKGTEFEDDWKAIDVNWENMIAASVTKIITVNLYTQLLYDKQVSYRGRFKETVAIGFVFKMI